MSTSPRFQLAPKVYGMEEKAGLVCLVVAGIISLLAVVYVFLFNRPKRETTPNTHLYAYFSCLLLGNFLQSFGTVMSLKWIVAGEVAPGAFCTTQAVIKQAGSIANAIWSFAIAIYLFELIFLRIASKRYVFLVSCLLGWSLIAIIIMIGPLALENKARGPYFGVSGNWCWITNQYPAGQLYLEYFFSFASAIVGIILYTIILLRVHGNLAKVGDKWRLRFVGRGEKWKLNLTRDIIDVTMMKLVKNMIWYPVAYTIVLIPLTAARFAEFAGARVPFWTVVCTAIVYNLIGFVNVMLFFSTRRLFSEAEVVPEFTQQRKRISVSLTKSGGIEPFTLQRSDTADQYLREKAERLAMPQERLAMPQAALTRSNSASSIASSASTLSYMSSSSTQPLQGQSSSSYRDDPSNRV